MVNVAKDDNSFVLRCYRIQFPAPMPECCSVLLYINENEACHIWVLRETLKNLYKSLSGVGSVAVSGVVEMKQQTKTLQNQRKSSFFFFSAFLSILFNEVKLGFVCAMTKNWKGILFVKLRGGIPTFITSWGTHELVSLSLEMELWQRPPITAINVLKFCSWWSFCVDILKKKISIYYLKVQVVQYAHPNSTFPLLPSTKVFQVWCHYPSHFIHFGNELWLHLVQQKPNLLFCYQVRY